MALKKFHRKHFIASAAAGILATVGFKRAGSNDSTAKPSAQKGETHSLVRKDPRAVSVDPRTLS